MTTPKSGVKPMAALQDIKEVFAALKAEHPDVDFTKVKFEVRWEESGKEIYNVEMTWIEVPI